MGDQKVERFHIAVMESGKLVPLCVSCAQGDCDKLVDSLPKKKQHFTTCGGHTIDSATKDAVWMREHGFKAVVLSGNCPAQGRGFSHYYPIPQTELDEYWESRYSY